MWLVPGRCCLHARKYETLRIISSHFVLTETVCIAKMAVRPDPGRSSMSNLEVQTPMVQLPTHADSGEDPGEAMHHRTSKRLRTTLIAGAVIVVAVVIVLHLTGVIGGGA